MSGLSGSKGEELVLSVEGMSCMHCVGKVESGLKGMEGVLAASVNLDEKQAVVRFDPEKVTAEQIRQQIVDSGYRVG